MSFDVFFQCFKYHDVAKFPRRIAWDAFQPFAQPSVGGVWNLSFPAGGGGVLFVGDTEEIGGLCVNRPSGNAVYDTIFAVLRQTPCIVHWGNSCAIATPEMIHELPPWAPAAFGEPILVHSGGDIIDAIEQRGSGRGHIEQGAQAKD